MFDIDPDTTGNVELEDEIIDETAADTPEPEAQAEPAIKSLDDALAAAEARLSPEQEDKPSKPAAAATEPKLEQGQTFDPVSGRVLDAVKAPGGLTPMLREKWGTVPREFQQYWADRERDVSQMLQETSEARKNWANFRDVAQPYEAMLRQNGTNAIDHAQQLFNLSYQLHSSTPQRKAELFFGMLNEFKPDAQTLQALLQNQPVPTQQSVQQPINVRQEMERFHAEQKQAEQAGQAQTAAQSFASDPANEFFDDVRDLMSRAIDAQLVDGSTPADLLKNAYEFACRHHPEVSKVISQRTPTATQVARTAPVARPNGQVKPTLGGARAPSVKRPHASSLDEAFERAYQDLSGQ